MLSASVPSSHRLGKQVIDPDTGLPKPRLKPNAGQLPRIVNRNVIGTISVCDFHVS